MESSLLSLDVSEASKRRYYNLTIAIGIMITVMLVGFFLYFSSKAFRQIVHIQRKIELMFQHVRLDYIKQLKIEEPHSQPKSKQGRVLKNTYELLCQDILTQKLETIDFKDMLQIHMKRFNYLVYYLQKKWKKHKQKKVKVLQPRATLNAFLYWCNLLTIWYLANILTSIASRLHPDASLAGLTFLTLLLVSLVSSTLSLLLTSFVYRFYEDQIEQQILSIFKAKAHVHNKISLDQSLPDEESGVKLFFGQERRYVMKEVALQNVNLVQLLFAFVAIGSLLFAICLYQMMVMEITFKTAVLLVFILAPLVDFFLVRIGLISLLSWLRVRQRTQISKEKVFQKQLDQSQQDESVFEIADNSQDSSRLKSNRSKLNNSIFPMHLDESSRSSFLEEGKRDNGGQNINEIFQNVAFYFEQSQEQEEDLKEKVFFEFKKREMGWLEEKLKFYDMVLLSFIDQTYGSVGGYKIIRSIQKSENYELIERLKEKVFNIKPQDDSLSISFDQNSSSYDLEIQEKVPFEPLKKLAVVEEVNEEMEQTSKVSLKMGQLTRSPLVEESTIKDTISEDGQVKPVEVKDEEELAKKMDDLMEESIEYYQEVKGPDTILEVEEECTQQTQQNFRDQVIEINSPNKEFLLIQSIESLEATREELGESSPKAESPKAESPKIESSKVEARVNERKFKKLSLNLEKLRQETISEMERMDSQKRRIRRKKKGNKKILENHQNSSGLKSTVQIKGKKRDKKRIQSAKASVESSHQKQKTPQKHVIDLKSTSSRAFRSKRVASTDMHQGPSLVERANRNSNHKSESKVKDQSLNSFRSSQFQQKPQKNPSVYSSQMKAKLSPYQEDLTKMISKNPSVNVSFCRSEKSVTNKSVSSVQSKNKKSKVEISQECLKKYYMYNQKQVRPKTTKRNTVSRTSTHSQQPLSNHSQERNAYFVQDEYDFYIHSKDQIEKTLHSQQVTSRTLAKKNAQSHSKPVSVQRGHVEIGQGVKDMNSFISRKSKQFDSVGGTTANSCQFNPAALNQDALSNSNCDLPSQFNSNFGGNEKSIFYPRNSQSYHTGEEMKALNWRVQSLAGMKIPSQLMNSDNSYQQAIKNSSSKKRKRLKMSHKHLKKDSLVHSYSENVMNEITNKVQVKQGKKKNIRKHSAFRGMNPLVSEENIENCGIQRAAPENDYFGPGLSMM